MDELGVDLKNFGDGVELRLEAVAGRAERHERLGELEDERLALDDRSDVGGDVELALVLLELGLAIPVPGRLIARLLEGLVHVLLIEPARRRQRFGRLAQGRVGVNTPHAHLDRDALLVAEVVGR